MKKLISMLITASLVLALFCTPAYAWSEDSLEFRLTDKPLMKAVQALLQEDTADSYVFQLSDEADADSLEELASTDELCEETGLYRTDDISLIKRLEKEGSIEQYAKDGKISLDGLEDGIEELNSRDYRTAMLGYGYAAENNITGSSIKIAVIDSGLWSSFSDFCSAFIFFRRAILS